ncbi:MAG: PhzF family phenazine biosynthesis isomerase [Burkholderiaceae bacterium]|nr:PhzF family phenazine biosynthesis isomerase [Burkholderiaceae bacterium]
MLLQKIAAFSDGSVGGNPAGVWISDSALPPPDEMQRIAAEVGFSETVFAAPLSQDSADRLGWRVRYFSPETEVPFCGHATIALGAALAQRCGDGVFALSLRDADITVEGRRQGGHSAYSNHGDQHNPNNLVQVALQSPPTRSASASASLLADALALFSYTAADLDPRIPPALIHGGADHLVLALRQRSALSAMQYALEAGRTLMVSAGLVTIVLVVAESDQLLHTRNAFASGGVLEDPATGAATAALAGYLRDLDWPHGGAIKVVQGEDMDMRSLLHAEVGPVPGSSIRVSGTARWMRADEG